MEANQIGLKYRQSILSFRKHFQILFILISLFQTCIYAEQIDLFNDRNHNSVKQEGRLKINIDRIYVQNFTLRQFKIEETDLPEQNQQSIWSSISQFFEKEDEILTNQIKDFISSFGIFKANEIEQKSVKQLLKHPIVRQTFRQNMENVENTMYYGPIWIGTPAQNLSVVYDTGSDWLVIESYLCRTCKNSTFNQSLSKTWKNISSNMTERLYGSASLYGYNCNDSVSIDKAGLSLVKNFTFFLIQIQKGIPQNIDGILGMSRSMNNASKYKTGPLYIQYLYNQSIIQNLTYSFYIGGLDDQSYIDIGYIDEKSMMGGSIKSSGFVWIKIPTEAQVLFWYGKASAIRYGEDNIATTSYTFDKYISAIFDTGTSLMVIPSQIASDFFGRILEGQKYVKYGGNYQISCKTKYSYQSIYLAIEGFWLQIHPDDYIIELKNNGSTTCVLGFQASSYPYFILGDVFLRGYYTVHDLQNNKIGFAPNKNSKKIKIQKAVNPKLKFSVSKNFQSQTYKFQQVWNILTGWITNPLLFGICFLGTCCFTAILILGKLQQTIQIILEYESNNNLLRSTQQQFNQIERNAENDFLNLERKLINT